jgi:transposase
VIPAGVRIWAAASPVDMRRGFLGLAEIAREQLSLDPGSGALLVFTNKRRDRLKLLWHDRSGFCLLYKRLLCGPLHKSRYAKPVLMLRVIVRDMRFS